MLVPELSDWIKGINLDLMPIGKMGKLELSIHHEITNLRKYINLQIQCNPYQATNGIFHRTRTSNFTICMEIQKTSNSQSNLEKEVWNWRNQPA